jgi:hypothetical protein
MQAKYIIFGEDFPMIFNDPITHKAAAGSYHEPVTSAGFCSIQTTKNGLSVSVWGKSVSLGDIESKPEDADVIATLFR